MNTRGSTKKRQAALTEPDSSSNTCLGIILEDDDDSDAANNYGTKEEISETKNNTNLDVVFDINCFRTVFVAYKRQITNAAKHPMMGSKQLCSRFLNYSDAEHIISRKGEPMSKRDFLRLAQEDGWLTDQVISFFLINVICERQKWIWNQKVASGLNMKRWYISNTYFFDNICPTKNANIPPWTFQLDQAMIMLQRIDFTLYSGHLIPIHLNGNHFAVLKVDFSEKTITYIDSLVDCADKAQLIMDAYIRYYCEGRARITPTKTTPIAPHQWTKTVLTCAVVTQQQNNYDCGVYCAMFIDFTLLDFQLKFQQQLAKYYRRFMFNQIALYMRNFETSTADDAVKATPIVSAPADTVTEPTIPSEVVSVNKLLSIIITFRITHPMSFMIVTIIHSFLLFFHATTDAPTRVHTSNEHSRVYEETPSSTHCTRLL